MGISIYGKTQCVVNINPQTSTTFCQGDSVILVASANGATSIIDQSQTNYTAGTSERNLPGYFFWQSFTAGITGTLTQIDIGFFGYINGVGTLIVYSGNGINGIVLYSNTVNVYCSNIPNAQTLSFAVNAAITAGMQYTFKFTPGAGIPDPYGSQVEITGTYSGGSKDGSSMDLLFKTYVKSDFSYLWSNGSTDSTIVADSSGTYSVAVTNSSGCTSSDSLIVTVNTENTSVLQSGVTLTANATGSTYQWIDCIGNTPISGQTNQSFTATANGNYAVIVTQNSCSDTSTCYNINAVGMIENSSATAINIYPNPSTGKFIIEMRKTENGVIEIYNVFGGKVYTASSIKQQMQIDLSNLSKGIYFIKLYEGTKINTQKIVIQ